MDPLSLCQFLLGKNNELMLVLLKMGVEAVEIYGIIYLL